MYRSYSFDKEESGLSLPLACSKPVVFCVYINDGS